MKKIILKSSLFFMVLLIISCSNPEKDFNKAKKKNSISLYEKLIKKYPKSEFTIQAKKNIFLLENADSDILKIVKRGVKECYDSKDDFEKPSFIYIGGNVVVMNYKTDCSPDISFEIKKYALSVKFPNGAQGNFNIDSIGILPAQNAIVNYNYCIKIDSLSSKETFSFNVQIFNEYENTLLTTKKVSLYVE